MTEHGSYLHHLYFESPEKFHEEFYKLVVAKCRQVSVKYPSDHYNDGLPWNEMTIADLAQDIYVENLLSPQNNQLDYIMVEARTQESIEALLVLQIKRVLRHRRGKNSVDRLIGRVRKLAEQGELAVKEIGPLRWYSMPEAAVVPLESLSVTEIARAADVARQIPIIWSSTTSERETKFYAKAQLLRVLELVLSEHSSIEEKDLRRIFDILLTPFLPAPLLTVEEKTMTTIQTQTDHALVGIEAVIGRFVEALEPDSLRVMVCKSQGISDAEIGKFIGRSRPTVAKYKDEYETRLRSLFVELGTIDEASIVMERLIASAQQRLWDLEGSK